MSNIAAPTGSAGGGTDAPDPARIAAALPARLRVHALAKLLSVSSKEVLATLADLGEAVRSAQSSIDRETALRTVQALLPEPAGGWQTTANGPPEVDDPGAPAVPLAPVFNPPAPVFMPPSPPKAAQDVAEAALEDAVAEDDAEADGAGTEGTDVDDADGGGTRRRRRRGRRGRGRGKGADSLDNGPEESTDSQEVTPDTGHDDEDSRLGTQEAGESPDADDGEDDSGETGTKRRR
ncbi:MAG: translation initiation factor IF-2 N-terminal domain-containing protein, partial [Actinomycetota bacterium]|nr:translation initiation factor IF-2 N-terminal domain-containing protein [Actinomycetota bacterium]